MITPERIGLALEQFLLTQVSADSKFDSALRGAATLTEEEQHGFDLFLMEYDPARGKRGADCFHCHGGPLFSDFAYKQNGLPIAADRGREKVTASASDAGKFKTPSLRNVAVTGPYMHDGRFATLEEVVVADFLLHVIDVTNPNFEHHHATTLGVLGELGASDKIIVTVFNKIDAATPAMLRHARRLAPDALFVSAHTKAGIDKLESRCLELIAETHDATELFVPHARYDVIAQLYALGHIHEQEHEENGVRIKGRFPASQAGFFGPFVVSDSQR